jgi:4'-phosphopantetheinyl transferase EntD
MSHSTTPLCFSSFAAQRNCCRDTRLRIPTDLLHGKIVFVITEAVYKAYSAFHGSYLDFHDLCVCGCGVRSFSYLHERGYPQATFLASVLQTGQGPSAQTFAGHFASVGNLIVALCSPTSSDLC